MSNLSYSFYIFFIFLFCIFVHARIENFHDRVIEEGESLSNKIVFITARDSIIGSSNPSCSVNQSISIANPDKITNFSSLSQVTGVFFSAEQSNRIGVIDDEGVLQLCCNSDIASKITCEIGEVIILSDISSSDEEESLDDIHIHYFDFSKGNLSDEWIDEWEIHKSGVYELLYINCDGSKIGDVVISGTMKYSNPFGELSAESYPLLWFFGIITFIIIIIGTIWGVFQLINHSKLISLQYFLSFLLIIEFIESFTWFIMLWVTNRTGNVLWLWLTITVLTSSVKRTAVGLLYLLISMGYGIMNKSKITDNLKLIILVISFYFIVSTGQELITTYIREGVVNSDYEVLLGFVSLILLFPSVVMPLGIFWWICACLSKTIQKVKLRKQETKIELYTKILISLIVACVVTVLMVIMQTGVSIVDSDELWRVWWLFTAFWFSLFFSLTISLLILFHPSKNSEWLSYTRKDILVTSDDFSSNVEIELDELEKDVDINFDFDFGFDDIVEEETSKLS